jgi:ribosomal protein L19
MKTNHSLSGLIDMHIHSGPDIRERKMDDVELMEASLKLGVRGIVIKSHFVPTVDRATLVNKLKTVIYGDVAPFTMFGGIVLNQSVGGINPYAVEASLKLGGKIVWLPTLTAANHHMKEGKSGGVEVVSNNKVVPELQSIMEMIKEYDAVLATGHISPKECFIVTEAARKVGVEKVVITHPENHIVGMNLEDQKKIVKDYDVLLEKVYAQPIGGGVYKNNLDENIDVIKSIGSEHIVVATDGGQIQNPRWNETIQICVNHLYDNGMTRTDVDNMTRKNPEWLLGL